MNEGKMQGEKEWRDGMTEERMTEGEKSIIEGEKGW